MRSTCWKKYRGICKVPGTISGSKDQVLQIWGKFPVFKDCKKFRKAVSRRYGTDLVLPQTLTEAVNLKVWWQASRAQLSPAEMLKQRMQWRWWKQNWTPSHEISDEYTEEVTRKCYEYVGTGKFLPKDRKIKNHSGDKKTATRQYFQELLRQDHYHSFMARWLREQMDNVLEHLPLSEVVWLSVMITLKATDATSRMSYSQSTLMWMFLCTAPSFITKQ